MSCQTVCKGLISGNWISSHKEKLSLFLTTKYPKPAFVFHKWMKLNKSIFLSRREPERLMSADLRCLQHRYLHLRYLSLLARPPGKLSSTDVIWSEIQLPKGRYQFACGSSCESGNSFCFSSSSTVHPGKDKNGKSCALLGLFKHLSEELEVEPPFWLLLCFIIFLRARHETTYVDFKWR